MAISTDERFPKYGVILNTGKAAPGYLLISPISSKYVFLLDLDGRVVHAWKTDCEPGLSVYLLPDGSILRAGKVDNSGPFPAATGSGGRIQRYDWDGRLVWDYQIASDTAMAHHDIELLPNGNVLAIVWEAIPRSVAIKHGRDPDRLIDDHLWVDTIYELKPRGSSEADIVWKWSLLDHVVQDIDPDSPDYGDPACHPELVDINYMRRPVADWTHINSVDYNAELDQIMVCSRTFSEFWIIDHSTTPDEAAGHDGGRCRKGGDLLYRWGNPAAWKNGSADDRMLFHPHDAHWICDVCPAACHGDSTESNERRLPKDMLIFNNGIDGTDQAFSSVDQIRLPLNSDGTYHREPRRAFGPDELTWTFEDPGRFFSPRISGAQRLQDGNTLICSGTQQMVLEVTTDADIVWIYRNPPAFRERQISGRPGRRRTIRRRPALADLSPQEQESLRIDGGVPLEQGGTLFRANRYPPDDPAFRGRELRPLPEYSLKAQILQAQGSDSSPEK